MLRQLHQDPYLVNDLFKRRLFCYNQTVQDEQIDKLIDAAAELVNKYGDEYNHTVAAAVISKSGKIITALNLFHFTGGPCAEVAVLSRATSEGVKDLTTIVAVGHKNRGILNPCGRCRQIILEYYPEMQVVVRADSNYNLKL